MLDTTNATQANTPEQIEAALIARNVHWPERFSGETPEQYRTRRMLSRTINKANSQPAAYGARHVQHYDNANNARRSDNRQVKRARINAAQQAKPLPVRFHKPKAAIPPTWPKASPIPGGVSDQQRQSRPVIVLRPVRAARLAKQSMTERLKAAAGR